MLSENRKRIASLTSNILNPFLVSLVLILLLSFRATSSVLDALKWSLIVIALSIFPVYSVVIYLVRSGKLNGVFTSIRGQRTKIYLLAGVYASVGCIILIYFKAPLILVAMAVAGLSAAVIFMSVNLWWKISLHTAFITAAITSLIISYGWIAAVALVLVPLVGWARVELKQHSLAQVVSGAILSALIIVIVFYSFGLA